MGYGVSSDLDLDEIRRPSLIIIFIINSYLFSRTFDDISVRVFRIYLLEFL